MSPLTYAEDLVKFDQAMISLVLLQMRLRLIEHSILVKYSAYRRVEGKWSIVEHSISILRLQKIIQLQITLMTTNIITLRVYRYVRQI